MSVPAPRLSQLQRAIAAYRQSLLALDDAALTALQDAYAPSRTRLTAIIDELAAQVQGGEALTTTDAMRLSRARELLRQVDTETRRIAQLAGEIVPDAQEQAVRQALEQARALTVMQAETTRGASRAAAQWTAVNREAVADLVGALSDGSPLAQWLDEFVADSVDTVRETLLDGVARGIHPEALAEALTRATDLPLNRALTLSRTLTMNAYRGAALRSYQENADILAGYERSASLSATSCAACIATAGKFYPLSHPFEEHVRGRCSPIPVLKDASLLPHVQAGPEWFAEQPASTQKTILGPGAYEAYRRNEIALEDMAHYTFDEQWGGSIQRASLVQARRSAKQRQGA